MNWKLLGAMAALIGVGASVALGQGTTPTIVQGDYISNVFGQSNFVKNPNAKLNTNDVTVSSATVSRSPTTALVATSEFNVAVTSANGTITWATRSFDAGMKNQNCEARFTYRGFQSTSKAHVKQGANTVATLNLSATGTDPRIASINFPCGDLSQPTTFVVTDTAILAGTNEIGGIYVGLATNQANVAQAEFIGSLAWPNTSTSSSVNATTFTAFSALGTAAIPKGSVTSPSNAPKITIPNMKAGNYRIQFTGNFLCFSAIDTDSTCAVRLTDGTTEFGSQSGLRSLGAVGGGNQGETSTTLSFDFEYTGTVASKTFELQGRTNGSNTYIRVENNPSGGALQISVYRFPTSSELVVTPERQNVFAGVVHTSGSQTLFSGSAEPTAFSSFNNSVWNQPARLRGKAAVTTTNSGNDLGFSVPNLPVGNYEVKISGAINGGPAGSGNYVICNFRIRETTTDSTVLAYQNNAESTSGTGTRDYTSAAIGLFNNTSLATRNFILEASKMADTSAGNTSICEAFTFSSPTGASYNTYITMTLTPLDQPSNSALYVQGPVLAGNTGTAAPAGYIGEIITSPSSTTGSFANGVVEQNVGTLTLTPGTWLVSANIAFIVGNTFNFNLLSISTTSGVADFNSAIQPQAAVSGAYQSYGAVMRVLRVTTPTPVYAVTRTWIPTGTSSYQNMTFSAVRIGSN